MTYKKSPQKKRKKRGGKREKKSRRVRGGERGKTQDWYPPFISKNNKLLLVKGRSKGRNKKIGRFLYLRHTKAISKRRKKRAEGLVHNRWAWGGETGKKQEIESSL